MCVCVMDCSSPQVMNVRIFYYLGTAQVQSSVPHHPSLPYYPTIQVIQVGVYFHMCCIPLVCNGHMSGGRGLLREVWIGGDYGDIDRYPLEPRSQLVSIQDKAYRDHSYTRDFGERNNFIQRYTGFFVPPVTSLYTFSILSDDLSRWYISPSMNPDEKKLVAYADIHTSGQWNRYESQTSAPMMMERGQYYYMEVYSNQYFGES